MKYSIKQKWETLLAKWKGLSWQLKLLLSSMIGGLIIVAGIVSTYVLVGFGFFVEMPNELEIRNISRPIASKIYANDDIQIGSYYIQNRDYLAKEQLNDYFKDALVATEDHRFYKHSGVDYKSLVRVAVKTILLRDEGSGGGSTITQQLVKNLFPRKNFGRINLILNKFREMHLARKFEKFYSKDEILWMYCSTVSFGERAFGLTTASKRFFNKLPEDLFLEEAALMVGILKATSYYSPRVFPERAKARKDLVLSLMKKHGYLSQEVFDRLHGREITLNYQSPEDSNDFARYFKQYLVREFKQLSGELRKEDGSPYDLFKDGLKIFTSLDRELQKAAEANQKRHMMALQKSFERSWGKKAMFGKNNSIIDDNILINPDYQRLRNNGLDARAALDSFNGERQYDFWSWESTISKKTTRIDSIKHYLKLLHSSILAADPQTGKIQVYVGGNDYARFQFDNINARRQVGSLFKPIVYLAALINGNSSCDYFKNELVSYPEFDDWTPRNANDEYGGYLSMNQALAHSVNAVSVKLMFDTGIDNVIKVARELGIESKLDPVPSMVLGTSDISLFEMLRAYSRIAGANGKLELNAIQRIEDRFGKVLFERDSLNVHEELALDQEALEDLRSMMFKVTTDGTGRRFYLNHNVPTTVISKTGTTQNQSDGWYIAASNDLIVGAWVGTEDRRMHFANLSSGAASQTALPLVGPIFEKAMKMGKLKENLAIHNRITCPDELTDVQFTVYSEIQKQDSLYTEREEEYGGWLKKLFSKKRKKKRLNESYSEFMIKKEIERLKKERKARVKDIDTEIEEWERILKNLEDF